MASELVPTRQVRAPFELGDHVREERRRNRGQRRDDDRTHRAVSGGGFFQPAGKRLDAAARVRRGDLALRTGHDTALQLIVRSVVPLEQSQLVRVTRIDGLTLDVERQSIKLKGSM